MTKEQFALWLQGYLQVNVFQFMRINGGGQMFDVQKVGDDVLEAARCVPAVTSNVDGPNGVAA